MVITTTACTKHGHPEFVLEADETQVPEIYLREITQTIERMVEGGSAFRPDQTFQVGWMITLVRAHDDGRLTLAEPDMQSFPIRWRPGITHTLRQMMLQLSMLDSVGLREEMDIPSIQHSLIACTHYADTEFFMDRTEASDPADTGWFVGCLREDHDHNDPSNLRRISLYEAFLHQPGIQGFAAFPAGSQIISSRSTGIGIARDGTPLDVIPGSLLDAWRKGGVTPDRRPPTP